MNKIMINAFVLCCAPTQVGCVAASASDGMCDTQVLGAVPSSPVPEAFGPVTFYETLNFSSAINKFSSLSDQVSLSLSQLVVTGSNLSWAHNIAINIKGSDYTHPNTVLGTYNKSLNNGTSNTFVIVMNNDQLYNYLQSGPVVLSVIVTGDTPPSPIDISNTLCVDLDEKLSKSL